MKSSLSLHTAANQHLLLSFDEDPESLWEIATKKLLEEFHFSREGNTVLGFGEHVYEDFVKDEIRISSGWDNWSGIYLLAHCEKGDAILRQLFEMLQNPLR